MYIRKRPNESISATLQRHGSNSRGLIAFPQIQSLIESEMYCLKQADLEWTVTAVHPMVLVPTN